MTSRPPLPSGSMPSIPPTASLVSCVRCFVFRSNAKRCPLGGRSASAAGRRARLRRRTDAAENQPRAVHEQAIRLLDDIRAFDEHRRLAVLDRVDPQPARVRRVDRAVGRSREIVEERRALDLHTRRDLAAADVDADHFVDVGHPQRVADAAKPLRPIEPGHPLRADDLAVRREARDVAVAVLVEDLSVDRGHEHRVRRGVVVGALGRGEVAL